MGKRSSVIKCQFSATSCVTLRLSMYVTHTSVSPMKIQVPAEGLEPTHSCEYWILRMVNIPPIVYWTRPPLHIRRRASQRSGRLTQPIPLANSQMTRARLESSARARRERSRGFSSLHSGGVRIKRLVATRNPNNSRGRYQCYIALVKASTTKISCAPLPFISTRPSGRARQCSAIRSQVALLTQTEPA